MSYQETLNQLERGEIRSVILNHFNIRSKLVAIKDDITKEIIEFDTVYMENVNGLVCYYS